MTQYEFMVAVRDNGYKCSEIGATTCQESCDGGCPLETPDCGFGRDPFNTGRAKLVDDWLSKNKPEGKMENLAELEKAYRELGKKIEDLKKPKIVFDVSKNYGMIGYSNRYILQEISGRYAFLSLAGLGHGACGHSFSDGQSIIDYCITDGCTVVELPQNKNAVIDFLLGKDR